MTARPRRVGEVFLKASCASRLVGAGMHRDAAEIQLQKLADAALLQMNIEFGGDAVTQVPRPRSWDQGRLPPTSPPQLNWASAKRG